MNEKLELTLYADSDGYITYECPYCGSSFKLNAGDLNDDSFPIAELFCPYCGLTADASQFISSEATEALETMAHNYVAELLNKEFGKMTRDINRKHGIIRMDYKPIKKLPEKDVRDKDTVESIFTCKNCQRSVKIVQSIGLAKAYCPFCGVDL